MKSGIVALVGRPNVGKSTLLNNLLKQKVAITSPKPQTTRFPLQAVYEDGRGQIVFVDTPGIFGKTPDPLSKSINSKTEETLTSDIDVLVYVIDYTRPRNNEENKTLGLVRKVNAPKILVINKTDISSPDFSADYAFYEDEFPEIVKVSALHRWNFNILLDAIFAHLPQREKLVDTTHLIQPGLNLDSKLFMSEIIREKVFLFLRDEVPYTVNTEVEQIAERKNGVLYVKGSIITTSDRYKKMLIGKEGFMIKKIGMAVRKELEQASGKQVFVDLQVQINPHWQETF
ncbi:MAG: GTPase Era [Candidatus Nomurabacteria bacterium GW2011_GWB1_37_5]|uniref:GTPase Era n=1 Tax=Candidatus Nomurabacteria bacterium GW2011_GWB1_37_5 TaxID=1618742 RepID=A0A0G0H6R1_9BACT|nr:MAG: GTPase Era [Candidatus Nomurabacteria bacterium GW2011_GWB1_37_5]